MMKHSLLIALMLLMTSAFAFAQDGEPEVPDENVEDPVEPEYVHSLAWSPDGSQIAVGVGPATCNLPNNDYAVRIVDPQTNQVLYQLENYHSCRVEDVDWNSDSTLLVSSGANGNTLVWDLRKKEPIAFLKPPAGGTWKNFWKPDSNIIASISGVSSNITLWDALTGAEIQTVHANRPYALAWNADGTLLASAGEGLQIWDTASWEIVKTISSGPIFEIAWSPDGNKIAGVVDGNILLIWDLDADQRSGTIYGHTEWIDDLKWRYDSKILASASRDGTVIIWDTTLAHQIEALTYNGTVRALDWRPNGKHLVYGGAERETLNSSIQIISVSPILEFIAHAGYDQVHIVGANGLVEVTLDASMSKNSQGGSYIWTENDVQIAEGETANVSLSAGTHYITLTITNDDNLTDSDVIMVIVNGPPPTATPDSN